MPLKIGFLAPEVFTLCGGTKRILEYASRLAAKGHESFVFTSDYYTYPNEVPREYWPGIKFFPYSYYNTLKFDVLIGSSLPSSKQLREAQNVRLKIFFVLHDFSLYKQCSLEHYRNKNFLYVANASWLKQMMIEKHNMPCELVICGPNSNIVYPLKGLNNFGGITLGCYAATSWKGGDISAKIAEMVADKIGKSVRLISFSSGDGLKTHLPYRHYKCPEQRQLAWIYGQCDIFIQSSKFEGFANTAAECMVCGVPLVTSDIDGVKDFAQNEENCLMYGVGNVEQGAEQVLRLLNDKVLAERLSSQGLEDIKKISPDKGIDKLEKIFYTYLEDR
jgi:hypothetical protein